jgi:hypothetical protein
MAQCRSGGCPRPTDTRPLDRRTCFVGPNRPSGVAFPRRDCGAPSSGLAGGGGGGTRTHGLLVMSQASYRLLHPATSGSATVGNDRRASPRTDGGNGGGGGKSPCHRSCYSHLSVPPSEGDGDLLRILPVLIRRERSRYHRPRTLPADYLRLPSRSRWRHCSSVHDGPGPRFPCSNNVETWPRHSWSRGESNPRPLGSHVERSTAIPRLSEASSRRMVAVSPAVRSLSRLSSRLSGLSDLLG